ncbi:oligosaccharide flippase family protein [Flavobacterium sp.]|uniref:oligosaccharide flippase family protein n=1 Tax=Flavobacterium sp. TaxID=239 RepID=UPI002629D66E|nr:oligosaccharide flippase family protein [Flavobacterium sp.]
MGIVIKQSSGNFVITYFGFAIGAVNALFLYTNFLEQEYYGYTQYLLSAANILMPFMAFGVHSSLIRFFSRCTSEKEKDQLLSFVVLLPLLISSLVAVLYGFFSEAFVTHFLSPNMDVSKYLWMIPVVGLAMAYFEIFYAYAKVHLRSNLGNFLSEVLVRLLAMIMLFGVHYNWITTDQFLYGLVVAYVVQAIWMFIYAVSMRPLRFQIGFPHNRNEILQFSAFIIVSGSIATLLLDLDKLMIPRYNSPEAVAIYGVAGFISTVIAVPARAMNHITYPLTAQLIAAEKWAELRSLYQKSALTLQIIGGLVLLGIFLNVKQLYLILPAGYEAGYWSVILVGLAKFYDVILGNNNAILVNTKHYKWALTFGVGVVVLMITFNIWLIPLYGITGAALATLMSVAIYNTVKLLFVVSKLKMSPFSTATLKSLLVILLTFALFFGWDFQFHPILNIICKSVLITIFYIVLVLRLKLSTEINDAVLQLFKKLRKA